MVQKMSILAADRQAAQEKNALLQRQLGNLDLEKREAERSRLRLEKDKTVLKKTLDKVSRRKRLNKRRNILFTFRLNENVWLQKTLFVHGIERNSIDNSVDWKKKISLYKDKWNIYKRL